MHSVDCFRTAATGELTLIATGMPDPPIVVDLETGASVTMCPAQVNAELARFGIVSMSRFPQGCKGNAWWGELPTAKDRTEARLALVVDGGVRNVTVRWPEPEPEPEPVAQPKRRRRKGSS
jgi:hypothetical protein